jgi:hypothetical protein
MVRREDIISRPSRIGRAHRGSGRSGPAWARVLGRALGAAGSCVPCPVGTTCVSVWCPGPDMAADRLDCRGTGPGMGLVVRRLVGLEARARDVPVRHRGQAARLRRLRATTRPIAPPIPLRTSDDGSGTELIEAPTPTSRKNSRVMGPAAVENSRTLPNACDPV